MSQNIKISLSTQGMKDLKAIIKQEKLKVQYATTKVVSDLVLLGSNELQRKVGNLTDYDGNEAGQVSSVFAGNKGTISNVGPQVAYVEFGTGIRGQAASHPQANKVGWQYNAKTTPRANRTIDGVEGWFYFNRTQGRTIFTPGARPYGQMLSTSLYLRSIIYETVMNTTTPYGKFSK